MKSPLVFKTRTAFQEWRNDLASRAQVNLATGKAGSLLPSVGFIPTMGALHEGHASLLDAARKENEITILSIFVNPTQFNNPDDLKHYPKTWEADLEMAKKHGVDAIFAPDSMDEMYPDDYRYQITEKEFSKELCGAHRPGHFDGVLTVVMKLFQLVRPTRAYFGEKDYQQLSLIQGMVEAFFLPIEIVPCPTLREKDGLAMSSRNVRLTSDERALAPKLYETITTLKNNEQAKAKLTELGFQVEYLVDRASGNNPKLRRYVAAHLGKVRLIDNVTL